MSKQLQHIAIIPDGNRRFARKKGFLNYKQGQQVLSELIQWCLTNDILELSVFAWSSENWSRPASEIQLAMQQLELGIDHWLQSTQTEIAFHFVSTSPEKINTKLLQKMLSLQEKTQHYQALQTYIFISYGFTEDIERKPNKNFKITSAVPNAASNPDLLIRTSGERRLSNFCMWHLAYTELMFIDALFPECTTLTWDKCLEDFCKRKRRYGK